MVRVTRLEEPRALTANRAKWVERWRRILEEGKGGDWATAAAKDAVREVLLRMTHGKCAYCESPLGVSAFVEIEHYIHKKSLPLDPAIALEWANLLPACPACNNTKCDAVHDGKLIKADAEDPEPMFWLNRGNWELEPHPRLTEAERERAELTIRICGLSRGALCRARMRCYQAVVHAKALGELDLMLEPDSPYKFVVRLVLTELGRADLAEADRARFLAVG